MKIRIMIGGLFIVIFVGTLVLLNLNHIINGATEIIGVIFGVVVLAGIFGIKIPNK